LSFEAQLHDRSRSHGWQGMDAPEGTIQPTMSVLGRSVEGPARRGDPGRVIEELRVGFEVYRRRRTGSDREQIAAPSRATATTGSGHPPSE
jgi:hypothetical protein